MNVWIRIIGILDVDGNDGRERATEVTVQPALEITVFRTEERAKEAQERAGGIVLEVDAKGLGKVNNEFGEDVLLILDSEGASNKSTTAYICVACEGTPTPNYGPFEPGTVEPQDDVIEFTPDESAWLDEFADETGFRLHQ